jgi:hypothetical protein
MTAPLGRFPARGHDRLNRPIPVDMLVVRHKDHGFEVLSVARRNPERAIFLSKLERIGLREILDLADRAEPGTFRTYGHDRDGHLVLIEMMSVLHDDHGREVLAVVNRDPQRAVHLTRKQCAGFRRALYQADQAIDNITMLPARHAARQHVLQRAYEQGRRR